MRESQEKGERKRLMERRRKQREIERVKRKEREIERMKRKERERDEWRDGESRERESVCVVVRGQKELDKGS